MKSDINDWKTWTFPKEIRFEDVSSLSERFEKEFSEKNIIFDLTDTIHMHSSFVGFLIHSKHSLRANRKNLILLMSFTVEKILIMLNIMDYFTPDTVTVFSKKSA